MGSDCQVVVFLSIGCEYAALPLGEASAGEGRRAGDEAGGDSGGREREVQAGVQVSGSEASGRMH